MIVYKCRNCGAVLYKFEEAKDPAGLLSPYEVALMYNFVCPKCKAPLNPDIGGNWKERIIVKPAKKNKP
jgi:transcription initiation factor IIE alpha subunit